MSVFYDSFPKHLKAALVQLVVPDSRGHNDSFSGGESRYVSLTVRICTIDMNKIAACLHLRYLHMWYYNNTKTVMVAHLIFRNIWLASLFTFTFCFRDSVWTVWLFKATEYIYYLFLAYIGLFMYETFDSAWMCASWTFTSRFGCFRFHLHLC